MNEQCNTGGRCNNIQSGVTIPSQVYQYQVIACVEYQVIACQSSGVRYQVLSDNMSSTSVRYQVSEIRCQVSALDIKCQGSGIKYKHINVR